MSVADLWHARWAVAIITTNMPRRHRWRRSGFSLAKLRRAAGREGVTENSYLWTPGRHTSMPRWTAPPTLSCHWKRYDLVIAVDSSDVCTALVGRPPGGRRHAHKRWNVSASRRAERLHDVLFSYHSRPQASRPRRRLDDFGVLHRSRFLPGEDPARDRGHYSRQA